MADTGEEKMLVLSASIFERLFCSRYWEYQGKLDMTQAFKRFPVLDHRVRHRDNHSVTNVHNARDRHREFGECSTNLGGRCICGFEWSLSASWKITHLSSILK